MSDLRTYLCTFPECSHPNQTFSTVNAHLSYEMQDHELQLRPHHHARRLKKASIKCPFCGQQTAKGTGQDFRARHVGRHMEMIAFTIEPKRTKNGTFAALLQLLIC